jgi:3-oxoacyl-(acyl-carrier-protein) synthase
VDVSVRVSGIGAVSPAGWGVKALRQALAKGEPIALTDLTRPGLERPLHARQVPPLQPRPSFLNHPRLRRVSAITRYTVAAALEALGQETPETLSRLGVIVCVMSGCVNYSRRFYDEVLQDPAAASPLLFPETVFNAPGSHLATLLGTAAVHYTLVGDPGTFLQGLALAGDWLLRDRVEGCLVVGAEEIDWITTESFRMFARRIVLAEGAGAVYLRREATKAPGAELNAVSASHLLLRTQKRVDAAKKMRAELPRGRASDLLCEGTQGVPRFDDAEKKAWGDWPGAHLAPKRVLGEGLMAAAAWQCVAAIDALEQGSHPAAVVSVVGCNQQAIGAEFVRASG